LVAGQSDTRRPPPATAFPGYGPLRAGELPVTMQSSLTRSREDRLAELERVMWAEWLLGGSARHILNWTD